MYIVYLANIETTIIHILYPSKIVQEHFSSLFSDHCKSHEKLKAMLTQNVGWTNRVLCYFLILPNCHAMSKSLIALHVVWYLARTEMETINRQSLVSSSCTSTYSVLWKLCECGSILSSLAVTQLC